MVAEPQDIRVLNKFYIDGKFKELGTSPIFYIGYTVKSFDIRLAAAEQDKEIFLSDKGVIKRIEIINRTGDPIYYKLNGSNERYKIITKAVLTQQPTQLLLDNDNVDLHKVIEVKIIGEEN